MEGQPVFENHLPHVGNPYSALERYALNEALPSQTIKTSYPNLPWWINPLAWLALFAIVAYQFLIPANWKRTCIYTPSCSRYGILAIKKYGIFRGLIFIYRRIKRCNGSLYLGGYDPP